MSKRRDDEPTSRLEERVVATVRRLVRMLSPAHSHGTQSTSDRARPGELRSGWRPTPDGGGLETVYPFLQREAAQAFIQQVSQRGREGGWQAELTLAADFSVQVTLRLAGRREAVPGDSEQLLRLLDELYRWETWR